MNFSLRQTSEGLLLTAFSRELQNPDTSVKLLITSLYTSYKLLLFASLYGKLRENMSDLSTLFGTSLTAPSFSQKTKRHQKVLF